jgi:hypothetical protein
MPVDVDEMRRQAVMELDTTEQEILETAARLEGLRARREGLRFTIEYTESIGAQPVAVPDASVRWSAVLPAPGTEVAQTDLCETTLGGFDTRQATTGEIRERLNAAGHPLDQEKVRSALAYLMRQKRVVKVSPGLWRLPDGTEGGA